MSSDPPRPVRHLKSQPEQTPERGSGRRHWTQRRGEARRTQLVEAAVTLLKTHDIDAWSLERVASEAGIPLSSVYHFYPDKLALLMAVANYYGEDLAVTLRKPYRLASENTWRDLLERFLQRAVSWYAATPGAGRLLIGGKTPPEVKLADRQHDLVLGSLLEEVFGRYFVLPQLAERTDIFFHAIEIADLFLQLSMIRFHQITPAMVRHGGIACAAYLGEFLPSFLPPAVPRGGSG